TRRRRSPPRRWRRAASRRKARKGCAPFSRSGNRRGTDGPEPPVIRRLLVANRGEIAVRVMHACRELGIETAAVYSDADAGAPNALAADRAIRIGPAPALESYLSIPRVIEAARSAEADAIHPGYGFLSENPAFAETCA